MNDALNSDIVRNSSNGIMAHIGSAKEIKGSFKAYVTYEYDSYKNDPDKVKFGFIKYKNINFQNKKQEKKVTVFLKKVYLIKLKSLMKMI